MRDLTRGSLAQHIIAIAAPIAVGMSVQTAHYLVDLYFVARLGGAALAGLSTAGVVFFIALALTQTLSVGTVTLVSHAVGRKDQERAILVFNQAVLLAMMLATVTLAAGYLGPAAGYVAAIGADAATIRAGTTYLYWFVPALAMQFALAAMGAALQGTGIVRPTMLVQLVSVLANVALTPVLVAGWGTGEAMGVAGAGLASSIAALIGLTLMTVYFFRLERYVSFRPRSWRPRFDVLGRMLAVGAPSGGEFALLFVYMAAIYAVIRPFGAPAQAGFGVGTRVMQAVFLPSMAIAFALPAVAGQNFGAQNGERVRSSFRTAMGMTIAIMATVTLLCWWRPQWLVAVFTSDPTAGRVAVSFLSIIALNFVASGGIFCCSGMFQAMGNTLPSLAAAATRILTFVVPLVWLSLQPGFRIEQVWYLSVATVWFQLMVSVALVRWQMHRKLHFAPAIAPGPQAASHPHPRDRR